MPAKIAITWRAKGTGSYCGWLSSSVMRWPRSRVARVRLSRSAANWEKALSSPYWARSSLSCPATCFIALVWAAEPTRETESPTLIAGRVPALKRSVSR